MTKTYTVQPIHDIESVKDRFSYVYSHITNKTVPLENITTPTTVQVVRYDKTMTTEEILEDFKSKGLKPASLNALIAFGLSDDMPRDTWLVAPSSVFLDRDGNRCFLDVFRDGDSDRELFMAGVGNVWDGRWAFLCEADKDSKKLNSSSTLDTLSLEKRIEKLESLVNPELLK